MSIGNHRIKYDLYKLFGCFLFFGIFGWVFETTYVFVSTGQKTFRGLLFAQATLVHGYPIVWGMPLIVMYGIGGCILASLLYKYKKNPLVVYFAGMVIITLFELLTSYFCEYVLHQSFWNYKYERINFQERISLRSSIAWGFISLFSVHILIPGAYKIYALLQRIPFYKAIFTILFIYTCICMCCKYVWM